MVTNVHSTEESVSLCLCAGVKLEMTSHCWQNASDAVSENQW